MAGFTTIAIRKNWCKSCGLCISRCPRDVLAYSEEENEWGRLPHPSSEENCTGCRLCELACPDFAIHYEGGNEGDKDEEGN